MDNLLTYGSFSLEYFNIGVGKKIILAFHGFGRTATDFYQFDQFIPNDHQIIAINLFHHGKSIYLPSTIDNLSIDKKDFLELFDFFFKQFNIKEFSILGYSLGGGVGLFLAEHFSTKTKGILVYAPDGLKWNFWNKIVVRSQIARKIYTWIIDRPYLFLKLIKLTEKFRILSASKAKFIQLQLASKENRQKVLNSWLAFQHIRPNNKSLIQKVGTENIPLTIIMGKYDSIIPPSNANRYKNTEFKNIKVITIPSGHHLLQEKHLRSTATQILQSIAH